MKATYALDVETVEALEEMARRWRTSKSDALRRAIRSAASQLLPEGTEAVAALDELQRSLALGARSAGAWARSARAERRASSIRGERRGG